VHYFAIRWGTKYRTLVQSLDKPEIRKKFIPIFFIFLSWIQFSTHVDEIITTHQRWAESEKLTPKPDPQTKTPAPNPVCLQILDSDPAPCPSLPCFYIHSIYIIPFIANPAFSRKFKSGSGSEKCSWTPDPLRSGSDSVPISATHCNSSENTVGLQHVTFY